ncbi:hypothetical protein CTAYLR_004902 [Chrysophaeum taylorii]|uniref:SPRY domain-containing protein n=1 Tax=Chrysophaeum taylorii TaxID=2483200 RepID=A0AAD7UPC3_9STRA|nr:hypothetical protein CTAYLR_004902 [Chrysophaeum taylorii]
MFESFVKKWRSRREERRAPAQENEGLAMLPENMIVVVFFFLEIPEVKAVGCIARVFAQCASEPSVWSELARSVFSRARGLVLVPHDPAGRSVVPSTLKRARAVSSWPFAFSPRGAHDDIACHRVGDGVWDLEFDERLVKRSNRCVAGNKPFGCFGKGRVAVPGVDRNGAAVWRAQPGAYFEVSLRTTPRSRPLDSQRRSANSRINAYRPCVAVGVCTSNFSLRGKQPGWDHASWGVHADDGLRFHGRGMGAPYGPSFVAGDTIGCGIFSYDKFSREALVFYTLNGDVVDNRHAFSIRSDFLDDLCPVIGMDSARLGVTVNLGTSRPFVFDLDQFLANPKRHKPRPVRRAFELPYGYAEYYDDEDPDTDDD